MQGALPAKSRSCTAAVLAVAAAGACNSLHLPLTRTGSEGIPLLLGVEDTGGGSGLASSVQKTVVQSRVV